MRRCLHPESQRSTIFEREKENFKNGNREKSRGKRPKK